MSVGPLPPCDLPIGARLEGVVAAKEKKNKQNEEEKYALKTNWTVSP